MNKMISKLEIESESSFHSGVKVTEKTIKTWKLKYPWLVVDKGGTTDMTLACNVCSSAKTQFKQGGHPHAETKLPDFLLTKFSFSLTKILQFYNLFVFSQPINDKFPLLVH